MDEDEKRLCAQCVDEPYLSERIITEGEDGVCDYCGRQEQTETITQLADRFEAMLDAHFEREGEVDYRWDEPHGETVEFIIADTGRLPDQAAADIQAVLEHRYADFEAAQMGEQTAFDSELTYVEKGADDRELRESWSYLERTLKTRRRFFSRQVEEEFSRLFEGVHELKTHDGHSVVRSLGPHEAISALYRGRVFQSFVALQEALVAPEQLIGSPASQFARAGRMNPHGVSVFYGATTEALTLAEVRPPVGSRVAVGRFDIVRPVQVLDVDALETVLVEGSLFDPAFAARLERAAFLKRLARRIRMPVMPDDEASDYVVTQAMADFLLDRLMPPLDGIAYGSAQGVEGINVALFNPSSRVRPGANPPGAKMDVFTMGDGDEDGVGAYSVWAEIDTSEPPPEIQTTDVDPFNFSPSAPDADWDPRAETLALDRSSLRIHEIKRICVKATSVEVRWTTWDKANEPF
jgi:hypothetical protein